MTAKRRGKWWLVVLVPTVAAFSAAWAKEPGTAKQPATPHSRQTAAADLNQRIIGQARQMMAAFPKSSYSHTTNIDPQRGVCEVDCSGYVAAVLGAVSPQHLTVIPLRKAGRKRPLAEDFYLAFAAAEQGHIAGWKAIVRVQDAQPGDVIAWWKEEHKKGENTGHVMIIAEQPVLERTGQWRLRILDSTATPHGSDTRPKGATGLGSGLIWLDTDSTGRSQGYRWKSATGTLRENPIAIGRAS